MPDRSGAVSSVPAGEPGSPPTVAPHVSPWVDLTGAAVHVPWPPNVRRDGWVFISLYTLAYMGTILLLLAPLLVTLALKVNSLVGNEQAPSSLALVTSVGALVALFANPFFGRMSDRT